MIYSYFLLKETGVRRCLYALFRWPLFYVFLVSLREIRDLIYFSIDSPLFLLPALELFMRVCIIRNT